MQDSENVTEIDLLHLSNIMSGIRDKPSFLHLVIPAIKSLININGMMIILADAPNNLAEPFLLYTENNAHLNLNTASPEEPIQRMTDVGIFQKVFSSPRPLTWSISDLMKWPERPVFITRHRSDDIKQVTSVALTNNGEKNGILFLFSAGKEKFQREELSLVSKIALPISNTITTIQTCEDLKSKNIELGILRSIVKNSVVATKRDEFQQFMRKEFEKLEFIDDSCIFIVNPNKQKLFPLILKQVKNGVLGKESYLPETVEIDKSSFFFDVLENLTEISDFSLDELLKSKNTPPFLGEWSKLGGKNIILLPLRNNNSLQAVLFLIYKSGSAFSRFKNLLNDIGSHLSMTVSGLLANEAVENQLEEISQYKRQLEIENHYYQQEHQASYQYSELVGSSPQMREAFHLVSQVAETNSSVLILGETGTGKELLARAIHNGSARKDKVMIKVNCATLPANLIESELFGHERGSFTGALDRRIGKFELANNSTIFLDEIGELPLALQAKLLRALQEKEIERVGGKTTIKTDIRIIAATNRDLFKAAQQGTFRSDLYFRLNVFPVTLPPLRERKDDIPLLANHFALKYNKKLTAANSFTSKAMKQLIAYNWPGNVRELEHLVQRSVLLSKGKTISQVYLPGANGMDANQPLVNTDVKTIDEIEREHILSVLKMVNGKVSGVGGAAEILKIPATTLSSKMIRLKIKKGIS